MEQAAGKAENGNSGTALADADHTYPQAQQDDPDIFHTVIGQQPLEIMLGQGKKNAQNTGNNTGHNQYHSPTVDRSTKQEHCPKDPVNTHFNHHPGHIGGDMTGRGRMGLGQPDMNRQYSRFHTKT